MSTDDTLNIIKEYAERSRHCVKWISACDSGIYDAMNQGYALSSGDVIVFFNDMFVSDKIVTRMMNKLSVVQKEDTDIVGAHADLVYANDDKVVRYWHMGRQRSLYSGWMPGHPTLFLKREIYEKYGLYDTSFKIAADYEFMIRFLKDRENRLTYLPETIIKMYYGGTSNATAGSYIQSLKEGHRALIKNGIRPAFIADILRTVRVLSQFVIKER